MIELKRLSGWVTWLLVLLKVTKGEYSVVDTLLGPVRGVRTTLLDKTVDIFYGIPFAKPPVGDLRFKRPLPHDPWNETRDAVTMPNSCPSLIDEMFGKFEGVDMWNPNTPLSEDCLYLNVWAPRDGPAKKAVLVWIFGGTFSLGTSTLNVYDGKYLAAANDVIVVSMNYRVGALGFLSWGEDAPGNVGLLDQAMAMKWVKDNIERFAGDPERITLFGESAGAASVSMHMLSPISRDLFNNAIMQSSSSLSYWALHTKKMSNERTIKLANIMNCTDRVTMMECLREKDANVLSTKAWDVIEYYFDAPFAPIVDNYFLLDTPSNLVAKGDVKNASTLLGVNKDEGTYFLLYGLADFFKLDNPVPLTKQNYTDSVGAITAPSNTRTRDVVASLYEHEQVPSERGSYRDILDDVSGDRLFKCPTIEFARAMSDINKNVYVYSFEHRVTTNPWPQWTGVLHGYEIEVVFGLPLGNRTRYTAEEVTFSEEVMRMWTNFAKNGDPNKAGQDTWPRYDVSSQQFVRLDATNTMTRDQGLRSRQCALWREIVPLLTDTDMTPSPKPQCVNGSDAVLPNYTILLITGIVILGHQLRQLCA